MSLPRPLLVDAVAALNILPKRYQTSEVPGYGTAHTTANSSNMALLDPEFSSITGQCAPLRRPIDRRWDCSRGIVFSSTQKSVVRDFRWSRGDAITFVEHPSRRRGYAAKNLMSSKADRQQTPQSRQSQQGLIDNPHLISSRALGGSEELRRKIDDERSAHAKTLAKREADIRAVRNQQEKLLQGVRDEREKLIRQVRDLQHQLAAPDLELKARAADFNEREAGLTKGEAELSATIAAARRDAMKMAHREVEGLNRLARERAVKADELQRTAVSLLKSYEHEHDETTNKLATEHAEELQHHRSNLQRALTSRFQEEMRLAEEAGLYRQKTERADYEAYHETWDAALASAINLGVQSLSIQNALFHKATWGKTRRPFDGAEINWSFPLRYPVLNQRLQEYLSTSYQESETAGQYLRDMRAVLTTLREDVRYAGHVSRQLTRYHRFDESTTYQTASLVSVQLNETPIAALRNQLKRELDGSDSLVRKVQGQTISEYSQQGRKVAEAKLAILKLMADFYARFKEVEALRAVLRGSVSEKEIYVMTQEPRSLLDMANSVWNSWMSRGGALYITGSRISPEDHERDRKAFVERRAIARTELATFETLVRKRRFLQVRLGQDKDDEEQLDAAVKERIVKAEKLLSATLERLVEQRSTAFARRPAHVAERSRPQRPTINPIEGSTQREWETRLRELRAKLERPDAYPDEKSRHEDYFELQALQLKLARKQLKHLLTQKAETLQKFPVKHVKLQNFEREIKRLKAKVAKLSPEGNEKASLRQEQEALKLGSKEMRRGKRARMHRPVKTSTATTPSMDSGASSVASPSRVDRKEPMGATLTFKPTASQQAPHGCWPARLRYPCADSVKRTARLASSEAAVSVNIADPSLTDNTDQSLTDNADHSLTDNADRSLTDTVLLAHPLPAHSHPPFSHASGKTGQMRTSIIKTPSNFAEYDVPSASMDDSDKLDDWTQAIEETSGNDSEESSYQPSGPESSTASTTSFGDAVEGISEPEAIDTESSDIKLSYQIPTEDYRKAVLASKNTNAAFWSYKLYKNAEGKSPTVYYCTNYEQTEARAQEFASESVLGFDMEWEMGATLDKSSRKHNVSLIQIASEDKIGLFHLALFKEDTPDRLIPPSLRAILQSKEIAKTGVNVAGDSKRLKQCLDVEMMGLFELSHLYNVVTYSESQPEKVNRKLFAIADQVRNVLLLPLKKDNVRTSAWSKKLKIEQTEYAASDAYAGFRLYHGLEAKRRKMDPMPPRPAFYEEHQPLRLGNGQVVVPKTYTSKKTRGVSDDAWEDCRGGG